MLCSSNRLCSPLRCSSEHCTIKILKARVRFCWIKQLPNSAERTHIGKRNKSRPLEGFQIIIRHGKINGYRHIRAHRSLTMADPRGQTHSLVDQSQVEICSDAVAPGQTSSSLQGKLPVVVAFGRSNNTATLHITVGLSDAGQYRTESTAHYRTLYLHRPNWKWSQSQMPIMRTLPRNRSRMSSWASKRCSAIFHYQKITAHS